MGGGGAKGGVTTEIINGEVCVGGGGWGPEKNKFFIVKDRSVHTVLD